MANKKNPKKPVENHKTAAWANIQTINSVSNVSHPSIIQAIHAKEYAEENQK